MSALFEGPARAVGPFAAFGRKEGKREVRLCEPTMNPDVAKAFADTARRTGWSDAYVVSLDANGRRRKP